MQLKNYPYIIRAKDVIKALQVCPRSAYDILRRIRKLNNKEKHQYVTMPEFSKYVGIPAEEIAKLLEN